MSRLFILLLCLLTACAPKSKDALSLAQRSAGSRVPEIRYRLKEAPNQMAERAIAMVPGSVWDGGLQRAVEELLSVATHRSFSLDPQTMSLVAAGRAFLVR